MSTLDPQITALLKDGELLIAAIVQDDSTLEVLMVAYMSHESLALTLSTGKATYWSRSRNQLWVKGETSGHYQEVQSVALDCDGDALLIRVKQTGVACHTGELSCFHRSIPMDNK
jgi:phosphoribosyl-AMP cyclohydrolase